MGTSASIQSAITNINNEMKIQIDQEANGNASTTCKISIGNIYIKNSEGCQINVENLCYANTTVSIESLSKVVANYINNLTNDQKQEAASWFTASFGISSNINNVSNVVSQHIKQKCSVDAKLDNIISVNDILIDNCKAPKGEILKMNFINTGSAGSQCVMKMVNDVMATGITDVTNKQSQGLDWSKLIWPISLSIIIITIVYILIKVFSNKILSVDDKIKLEKNKKNDYASRISRLLSVREIPKNI